MDAGQLLELKHLISGPLLLELLEQASHIDPAKYPRPRFVLEFNFDAKGLVADAAVEVRYRRSLKG